MSTESTLWMGDIEPWMNEEIIMKSFTECGINPTSIKIIKDKRLNLLRNYCFINFDNMIEANKALIQLNGKKLPNADFNFKLNWANQNCEGNLNLYVGNLSHEIDDIELYNLFKEKYPSVHHASIITDKGISKGYGFIHFSDRKDYDKCLKEMDGYIFHNLALKVKERKKKNDEKNIEENKNSGKNKNIIKNVNLNIQNNLYRNNKYPNDTKSSQKLIESKTIITNPFEKRVTRLIRRVPTYIPISNKLISSNSLNNGNLVNYTHKYEIVDPTFIPIQNNNISLPKIQMGLPINNNSLCKHYNNCMTPMFLFLGLFFSIF